MPCHGWSLLFWWSAIAVRQLILVSLQTQSWAFNTLVRKRKEGKDMMCGQVWCPILGVCALHLTHPSAHTQQWDMKKHTHTHTHCEHPPWAVGCQCCGTRGAVGGSVPCSRVSPQSWYWEWRECWPFTPPPPPPPTIPAGPETRTCNLQVTGYKSIIPRLPQVRSWKCTCAVINY